jgi:hypothetical protein
MPRPSDKDRVLWLLQEIGGTSNQQIRSVLSLADDRYKKIIQELLNEDNIEKYRCRGGGIRITTKGAGVKALPEAKSSVTKEKDLYVPFVSTLESEVAENEEFALVFDTSALRKSGKWSNPDVTKISIRNFPVLRSHKVLVTTFELKQWNKWNVDAVFEAASHRRFAHEAYVVLEWAKDVPVEGLEEITSACGRFGVGLVTLHPYYSSFRYIVQLDAEPNAPSEDYVDEYLGYVFERDTKKRTLYDELWERLKA